MITSIVPLPEFAAPGTVIYGKINGGIYGDEMSDIPELDYKGRDIIIHPEIAHKYKIRFADQLRRKEYVVIFMTTAKLNLFNLSEQAGMEIYPIYLREYNYDGAVNRLPSNTILSVEGVTRFLKNYGAMTGYQFEGVVSVATAVRHVINRCGLENYECLPKYFKENMYDTRYGTLAPTHEDLVNVIYSADEGSRYALETVGDYNCILSGYLPFNVDTILRMRYVGELISILDPNYRNDMMFMGIMDSMSSWGSYYTWIHECDDSCPRYVNRSENDAMTNLLFHHATINTGDFRIDCVPPSVAQPSGKLFNAHQLQAMKQETDFAKLSRFGGSVREQVHLDFTYTEGSCCNAVGSYMEDVLVYNTSGNLIAYIDLVWWILARGAGLLNEYSTLI